MKKLFTLLFVVLSFLSSAQNADDPSKADGAAVIEKEIIILNEITRNNAQKPLNKPNSSYPVVDINSTIQITFDKAEINSRAGEIIGYKSPLPVENIERLKEILRKEKEVISLLTVTENESIETRLNKFKRFSAEMGKFFDLLILTYPPGTRERAQLNEIISKADLSIYEKIYRFIELQMQEVNQAFQLSIDSSKVYFRLAGWIKNKYETKPIHIPGFDSYQEGEFYEVPRFVTAIPKEEIERFEQLQGLAKSLNQTTKNLNIDYKGQIIANVNSLINFIEGTTIASLRNALDSIPKDKVSEAITKPLNAIINQASELNKSLLKLKTTTSDFKTSSSIIEVHNAVQEVILLINPTINVLNENGPILLKALSDINNLPDNIREKLEEAKRVISQIRAQFLPLVSIIQSLPNTTQLNVSEQSLIFGEEVSKLLLSDLPTSADLDLRTSGFRENGSEIYFKASLGIDANTPSRINEKVIYYKRISLYQILFHLNTNAVLLFTDNLSSSFENNRQFQLNPSYSILAKFGSRKSVFFNRYLSPGVGINISTADFDNDDNPEIGIGIVGSMFHDFVQVGLGRNMYLKNDYWFFGIRIPLLGINFNGLQGQPIEVQEK